MNVSRFFTIHKALGEDVFDMFRWKKVDILIKDYNSNTILFEGHDLEFPEHYSQTACDIIAKMYFRKRGVPETDHEVSLRQVIHRMVDFWCKSAIHEGLIVETDYQVMYDELAWMMCNQMWAPNSPQWFNTGLKHAYGITGEACDEYYWDEKKDKVVKSKDGYTRSQASACFIVGVNDSLLGEQSLMDNLTTASRLFKYGSGVGSNWSKIRAEGEHLSGGGYSSGLLSFQKVYDRNAGAIKSGGVTRRAAVMQVLDLDHPEILNFVRWKSREEDKVVALGKMGYDVSIAGDAYGTVSGQNVNNSVSIPDKFMEKVEDPDEGATWDLIGRKDHSVDRKINAKHLWDEICWAAWRCGDPGVQYTDTINAWNTCAPSGRIEGSNPCSEYLFLNDTSCNLASINVLRFWDEEKGEFNYRGYVHAIDMIQIALEATIHWGQFPTPQIAENTHKFRATGLGLTNIGALLMAMGLPYDSAEARTVAATLCGIMTAQSYLTSAKMAEAVGPFPEYKRNKKCMRNVIIKHKDSYENMWHDGLETMHDTYFDWSSISNPEHIHLLLKSSDREDAATLWNKAIEYGDKFGYRNAQTTVLAPTGTIAFAMDCATTSSEPFFSHKVYKKVVDGSYIASVNPMIGVALKHLGYNDESVKAIEEYVANGDGKIEGAPYLDKSYYPIFDTANRCGSGERYLLPMAHVKMVAACTPHLSGGISKTVNLPSDASVDDIKDVYMQAWKLGCKCIALYRDGCKVVQPLTTTMEEVKDESDIKKMTYWELLKYTQELQKKLNEPHYPVRERIPYEPVCKKNAVKMDGYTFHIQRSFYPDGRLGEIFVTAGKQGDTVKGLMEVICILISKVLQYGIPVEVISEILRGTEFSPRGMVRNHDNIKSAASVTDLISKFMDISVGDYSHCQVKPEHSEEDEDDMTSRKINKVTIHQVAGSKNFAIADGGPQEDPNEVKIPEGERVWGRKCPECGSTRIVKAGTCYYCQECGTSSGCS